MLPLSTRSRQPYWPHPCTLSNLRGLLRARLGGSSVSLSHVTLQNSLLGRDCLIGHHAHLADCSIGHHNGVAPYSWLTSTDTGSYCGIAAYAIIGTPTGRGRATSHPFPYAAGYRIADRRDPEFASPPIKRTTLGSDVWIGNRALILAGLRIGHGAVVGAGAVVTRDVEDFEVVTGVPARHLKFRFSPDVITRMLTLRWWEWPDQVLRQHWKLFRDPVTPELLLSLEAVANASGCRRS